jgi:hypothetical protein
LFQAGLHLQGIDVEIARLSHGCRNGVNATLASVS